MEKLLQAARQALDWLTTYALSRDGLIQLGMLGACVVLGLLLGLTITRRIKARHAERFQGSSMAAKTRRRLLRLVWPMAVLLLLLACMFLAGQLGITRHILRFGVSLVGAWVAAGTAAMVVRSRFWYQIVVLLAWIVAVLYALKLTGPVTQAMDEVALDLGTLHLTLLTVVKGAFLLFIMVRLGLWLAGRSDAYIASAESLTPSMRVLLGKFTRFSILALATLFTLNAVGVNLASLAVLGGAVGLGLGFGLQKVVANLVSGLILLMDKSIKPGDVIQLGDVYGWITRLQARYVSVQTRDGFEYLIPNEDLITNQVINWSFTDTKVRVRVPIGVAYESDLELAMRLALDAAKATERVISDPEPRVLLKGFGDSSVDLEVRVWISDPHNGVSNLRSDVLLGVWHAFKAHGISIPFPQRDVHLDLGELDREALRGLATSVAKAKRSGPAASEQASVPDSDPDPDNS